MSQQNTDNQVSASASRMRIGIVMIVLWWLPFWLLAPHIASSFNSSDPAQLTATITLIIVIIQTAIGGLGIYLVGKPVYKIVKATPRKQVPHKVWQILVHGKA